MARNSRQEAHQTITQFKGVNLTDPPHGIDDREFESVKNLIVNDAADLIRRKPMRTFHAQGGADSTVMGIFYGRVLYSEGDNILLSPINTAADSGTYVNVSTIGENTNGPLAVLYKKNIYWFSNVAASGGGLNGITVSDWTASSPTFGAATVANPTLAAYTCKGVMFKDRLFFIQQPDKQSSTVRYSAIVDPGALAAGQLFDVNPGDGDFITDICVFGERLFIFKRYSTWYMIPATLPSDWVLKQFDRNVGATLPYCSVEYRGLLYVLSPRGLYRTDGVVYDYIGYPVQERWMDASPIDILGVASYHVQVTMVDDYIFVNSGSPGIGFWFYNPVQNSWTECVFPDIAPMQLKLGVQGTFSSGERATLFGSGVTYAGTQTRGDIIYFGFTDTDYPINEAYADYVKRDPTVGSRIIRPVQTSFRTKAWDFGAFFRTKRHKLTTLEIEVPEPEQATATDVEFTSRYLYDRAGVTSDYEFNINPNRRGNLAHKIPGMGMHRRLQLELESATTWDYSLTGYDLVYLTKRESSENPE